MTNRKKTASPRARKGKPASAPDSEPAPEVLAALSAPLSPVIPADDEPLAAPRRARPGHRTAAPSAVETLRDVTRGDAGLENNGHVQQMLHLRNLLHNPLNIDLREVMLDSSSTRDEIAARLADLKHRIATIEALSNVLKEEVQQLQDLLDKRDAEEPAGETPAAAEVAPEATPPALS